jgi:hypothetical protein
MPRRRMYWEHEEDVHNEAVSSLMSRNEFEEVLQYLHVADNGNLEKDDKFAKVRPLLQHINERCKANFVPEQNVSIDEAMIPYYGRHGAKQYLHGKPFKFGYKMWVAATRLGYVIAFEGYQGKGTTEKQLGLGGSVVTQLPENETRHYHLIFDHFFTSISLLHNLQLSGIAATGTLRSNRDLKAPLKSSNQMEQEERGSYDFLLETTSQTSVVRWKDNKCVTVASTYAGVNPMGTAQRYIRSEGRRRGIQIPYSFQVYNFAMGGVDRFDQNIAAYMINIRTKKWWWPIFRFTVDLAIQNAHQLYRLQSGVLPLDLLGFRRSIVDTYKKGKNDKLFFLSN